jgi:hypothetical protein
LLVPPPWKIAENWATVDECRYPLNDTSNLPRVALYRATNGKTPYDDLYWEWISARLSESNDRNDVHRCLASVPFNLYVCTHYFNFMTEALQECQRDPRREFCRWRKEPAMVAAYGPSLFEVEPGYDPSAANPLVYHLYGLLETTESLVLTEDDYLDFLVQTSGDSTPHSSGECGKKLLPPIVDQAMTKPSLLFLGYQLNDLDFRVLLRKLVCGQQIRRGMHLSVQIVAVNDSTLPQEAQQLQIYVDKYLKNVNLGFSMYPGTLNDFAVELRRRWRDFDATTPGAR